MVVPTRIYIMSVNWTIHLQWLLWLYILEIWSVIDKQECGCVLLRLSKQAPIASVTPATALGLPACNFMAQKYTMSHSVNIHSWWRLAHLPPVCSTCRSFFFLLSSSIYYKLTQWMDSLFILHISWFFKWRRLLMKEIRSVSASNSFPDCLWTLFSVSGQTVSFSISGWTNHKYRNANVLILVCIIQII